MKYQKRHYEDVARVLSETFATIRRAEDIGSPMNAEDIAEVVVIQFTSLFAKDNDQFQSQRFVDAAFAGRQT